MTGADDLMAAAERALGLDPVPAGETPAQAAAREGWERRLVPLALALPAVPPPTGLFARIEAEIAAGDTADDLARALARSARAARRWRGVAVAWGGVAAASLAALVWVGAPLPDRTPSAPPGPSGPTAGATPGPALGARPGASPGLDPAPGAPAGPTTGAPSDPVLGATPGASAGPGPDAAGAAGTRYAAALTGGAGGGAVVVEVDAAGGTATLRPYGVAAPRPGMLELWLIAPGAAPATLGPVAADRPTRVALTARPGDTLAITLEPPGGAPGGIPSGAPILSGRVLALP